MVDIQTILTDHKSKIQKVFKDNTRGGSDRNILKATASVIPDLFFDQILIDFKLNRVQVIVIMYLYRAVWCRPNLYKKHGISPLLSLSDMSENLHLEIEDIFQALRQLEEYSFIITIRSGQYFVRRFFTKDNDATYNQTYDDFEI
ncbi:MAG: hypothetical protein ISR65_14755 [Bacteriovoracaceae bacterium]|nr:hypothetical protein [Bacteriovoracaceae bacterium]